MDKVTTVGIDLAKRVFALHGVDGLGRVVLRKTVRREQFVDTVAKLPPCLIGMEACSGSHEWARRFQALGHTVRLMAPVFVVPYRKSGKNDGNDAEATVWPRRPDPESDSLPDDIPSSQESSPSAFQAQPSAQ